MSNRIYVDIRKVVYLDEDLNETGGGYDIRAFDDYGTIERHIADLDEIDMLKRAAAGLNADTVVSFLKQHDQDADLAGYARERGLYLFDNYLTPEQLGDVTWRSPDFVPSCPACGSEDIAQITEPQEFQDDDGETKLRTGDPSDDWQCMSCNEIFADEDMEDE